ncbi:MAG: phosphoglycerate dehydrogenase, partial [Eggerthellaceae bacterium]
GIVVFNTPGANANAVKEIIICSLLLGSRGILDGIEWCREHADDENIAKAAEKVKKQFAGQEIKGKKLGVIGLGAVGAEVANAAVELGMDVYGYDPFVSVSAAWKISSPVHHITDLADIFRTCDYITIHVPALKDTVGMIDAHTCSLMKEGVVLLNFSRETLVDTAALSVVLDSGRVKMYITDFATPEVMKLKNTVVMPHLGASTAEAEDNCAIMAVREMVDYFENGNITNSVNYPACDMGVCPAGMTRLAMLHANVPNMIGQITNVLGEDNVNIANLMNKARGNHAYTLIDLDQPASDEAMAKIRAIEGVRRVRMI